MAAARRSRTLPAAPEEVWAVVGDAHHLPRWWPRVTRVENVDDEGFTMVLQPPKGRPVRADYSVARSQAPAVRAWAQEIPNSPFERILSSSKTEIHLQAEAGGTRVSMTLDQRPRGMARLGAFMVRAAARRQLDEALDALEALVTGSSGSAGSGAASGSASRPGPVP